MFPDNTKRTYRHGEFTGILNLSASCYGKQSLPCNQTNPRNTKIIGYISGMVDLHEYEVFQLVCYGD